MHEAEKTVSPWYSLTGDVYHVRLDCGAATSVLVTNRVPGTGKKRVCLDCLVLLMRERGEHA